MTALTPEKIGELKAMTERYAAGDRFTDSELRNVMGEILPAMIADNEALQRRVAELTQLPPDLAGLVERLQHKRRAADLPLDEDAQAAATAILALQAQVENQQQINRELLKENSTLHNKQTYPIIEAEYRGEERMLEWFRRWRADPSTWDTEDENRNFRQIRYAFDAANATLAEAMGLLAEAKPQIYNDYGPKNSGNTELIARIAAFLARHQVGETAGGWRTMDSRPNWSDEAINAATRAFCRGIPLDAPGQPQVLPEEQDLCLGPACSCWSDGRRLTLHALNTALALTKGGQA